MPDAVLLSLHADGVFVLRHRRLGYALHCHAYRILEAGPAFQTWLRDELRAGAPDAGRHPARLLRADRRRARAARHAVRRAQRHFHGGQREHPQLRRVRPAHRQDAGQRARARDEPHAARPRARAERRDPGRGRDRRGPGHAAPRARRHPRQRPAGNGTPRGNCSGCCASAASAVSRPPRSGDLEVDQQRHRRFRVPQRFRRVVAEQRQRAARPSPIRRPRTGSAAARPRAPRALRRRPCASPARRSSRPSQTRCRGRRAIPARAIPRRPRSVPVRPACRSWVGERNALWERSG